MNLYLKTSVLGAALVALFLALACAPAAAGTMRIAMVMDVKTHQSRATFGTSREHADEEWLYLTQAREDVEIDVRLSMSGQKEQVKKGRTTVEEVPGVTPGVTGYKRAKLETFGNETTLIIESKFAREKTKDGKDTVEKEESVQRIPLRFKSRSATLQDIRDGKTVQFEIPRAGLKSLLDGAKSKTEAGMNLKAEGEGAKVSMSSWARFLGHKGLVFISARKIEYEAPPMRVHVDGSVRVSGPAFK